MARNATSTFLAAIWALLCFSHLAAAISPISVKGTKLYDDDGNQFFIKGVAYSYGSANIRDPLVDTSQCQIDAGLMNTLGVNTIRVYIVDGTQNHDSCMQAFAAQGIYVWLDLPTPLHSMSRVDPEWTMELYTNWTTTVDAFAGYDNLLAFTIGNEVINSGESTIAAPYIKAAARDVKAFRDARGYRRIPVSYTAADYSELRVLTPDYLACTDDSESDSDEAAIDLYGMNVYSWCGNSSYYKSGFDQIYEQFESLNIPVVFSETGCTTTSDGDGRDFAEVATMLGPVFQAVFSGAVVYEWAMEENGYGIVEYSDDDHMGFPTTLDDYNALSTVFSSVNPTGTARSAYTPSNSAPSCPTYDKDAGWLISPDAALPTIAALKQETITARTTIVTATGTDSATGSTGGAAAASETAGGSSGAGASGGGDDGGREDPSTGAIVGIAIGCAAAVVLVAVAAFFIIRRRRSAKRQMMMPNEKNGATPPEADANGGSHPQQQQQPGFKAELPAQSVRPVLPRQEMDASQQQQQAAYLEQQQSQYGYYKPQDVVHDPNIPSPVMYEMEGSAPVMDGVQPQYQQPLAQR